MDQFKSSMKAANGLVSEDQFFKESAPMNTLTCSFFPNGEYNAGVSVLQDVDGRIQKLRDDVVRSVFLCRSVDQIFQRSECDYSEDQNEETHCRFHQRFGSKEMHIPALYI